MNILGVDIKGDDARLVLLISENKDYIIKESTIRKIILKDDLDQKSIQQFFQEFCNFIEENNVEQIVIKKRSKKGQFSGGAVGFKIEGLIQLQKIAEVSFINPITVSKTIKQYQPVTTEILKYQEDAFYTAFCFIQSTK